MPAPLKPIGVFAALDYLNDLPSWVSVGYLADGESDARFALAAAHSRRTGFRWIVNVEPAPDVAMTGYAAQIRARLDAAGVLPYVAGLFYGEEWYEGLKSGRFAAYGLRTDTDAHLRNSVEIVRDFVGIRMGELHAVFGLPVAWLTSYVQPDPTRYGAWWYQPVPQHVDVIALDIYTACGEPFAHAQGKWDLALASTTQPIVIVPQWFQTHDGSEWDCGPPPEAVAAWARWLAHPRAIGMLGFDFKSRPFMHGLEDLPALRSSVMRALGVS